MANGTYIELEGTFNYSINQSGLDYDNPEERQEAIDDFKRCFEEFLESIKNDDNNYLNLDYDLDKIEVSEGE